MKLDLVDPVTGPVVGPQYRGVLVRQPGLLDHLGRACRAAQLMQLGQNPVRAVRRDSGQERLVRGDIVP
jgi:hypothetical protein